LPSHVSLLSCHCSVRLILFKGRTCVQYLQDTSRAKGALYVCVLGWRYIFTPDRVLAGLHNPVATCPSAEVPTRPEDARPDLEGL
jgi:hypothetical protein